jgi:hypothetical protein
MRYKTGSLAEKERERQFREIYEWALRTIANARKKRSARSSDAASLPASKHTGDGEPAYQGSDAHGQLSLMRFKERSAARDARSRFQLVTVEETALL